MLWEMVRIMRKALDEEMKNELHLWVSLLIRYLKQIDGLPEGRFFQSQGEDECELIREAMREHLTGTQRFKRVRYMTCLNSQEQYNFETTAHNVSLIIKQIRILLVKNYRDFSQSQMLLSR